VDRLDIPIGEIWASPYCRSKDTAELAFGRFEVVDGLERLYPERGRASRRAAQPAHPGTGAHTDEPTVGLGGKPARVIDVPARTAHRTWNAGKGQVSATWTVTPVLRTEEMYVSAYASYKLEFLFRNGVLAAGEQALLGLCI
jgi:hypothetical protein